MVQFVTSPAAKHLSSTPRPSMGEHLETYLALVHAAMTTSVERGVCTDALVRALRTNAAYDVIDAFFHQRLREALRICAFMGPSVQNPVSAWLTSQDTRVLQRLLHVETKLDAAEVERVVRTLEELPRRRLARPLPVAVAA